MIGNSIFNYANKDVCALIRKDLVDKFGTRELSGYDMTVPDIITVQAKVSAFPNPVVTKTSVEDQIAALKLPFKPSVPRSDGSVTQDIEKTGGDNVIYAFDRPSNTLTIAGGPVLWSEGTTIQQTKAAHWVGVTIAFPLGITPLQGQILPYSHNGKPKFIAIDEAAVENKFITLYFDAAFTTNELIFNWDEQFEPEKLSIVINASLQDSAVRKIPALPTEPIFSFTFPQQEEYCAADVNVHVDLSYGK